MALPTLSDEQRQQALEKAAAARRARSALLEEITAGTATLESVLKRAATDEIVKKTKVARLLKALPGYGPAKVTQLLEHAGIAENRKIGGLGGRQRQALLAAVG